MAAYRFINSITFSKSDWSISCSAFSQSPIVTFLLRLLALIIGNSTLFTSVPERPSTNRKPSITTSVTRRPSSAAFAFTALYNSSGISKVVFTNPDFQISRNPDSPKPATSRYPDSNHK